MATFTGRFLQLSKLTTEWNAADPVLMNGELGVADAGSSAPILKVGDGVRPWSALPQISGSGGGAANDYVVGTTTTLAPGSFATVVIDNGVDPPTISFGIPRGNTGPANTLAIGTTTTGAPGTPASATITGTPPAQTLNLIIPQGDVGPEGAPGADGSSGATGAPGPANNLTIGTVTTGAPGTPADATITGTPPAQELNLTIPRGADGAGLVMVDPTGVVGLTMVPGVAATTMRSDSSPPLSQAIAPTWTGLHTFDLQVTMRQSGTSAAPTLLLDSAQPVLMFNESDQGADAKRWEVSSRASAFVLRAINDANSLSATALSIARTGFAIASLAFGNATDNPPYNFLGTGVTSVSGQIVVGAPAGGATGTGTINATAFFDDGVQLVNATAGNPSALVGLAAINGAAVTFMRSDAAPALNQAIAPTWTAAHTFVRAGMTGINDAAIVLASVQPNMLFVDTDAATNEKVWRFVASGPDYFLQITDDGNTVAQTALKINRSGAAVAAFEFGNVTSNPTYSFLGSGLTTHGGSMQVNGDHIAIANTDTYFEMRDTDAGTDEKVYWLRNSGGTFALQTRADSLAAGVNALTFTRVGVNPTQMLVGADGTAALPGISFWNDNNTGIYRAGADDMRFVAGGNIIALIQATSFGPNVQILAIDGSAAAPEYSFASDPDTGIYRRAANDMAFAIGGVLGAVFSATQNAFTLAPLYVIDGTSALPGIAFNNDTNTGFYRWGIDAFAATSGGTAVMSWRLGQSRINDGTVALPALTFENDTDTGIYRVGGDVIGVALGGVKAFEIAPNTITVSHPSVRAELRLAGVGATAGTNSFDLIQEATAAYVLQRANVQLLLGTNGAVRLTIAAGGPATFSHDVSAPTFTSTSSRRIKRETGAPARARDMLSRLRPILYRLLDGDDREQVGLIAEEVHEVCPQLSDGKSVAYDRLAILLLAAWQDDHAEAA